LELQVSREEYVPNERIVDRAVYLWLKALRKPQYNNGGGLESFMASGIASMLPKNNDEQTLARFGAELKTLLMSGEVSQYGNGESFTHYQTYLGVDYHPDKTLSTAAEAAGLKMEFPWKTSMHLWTNYVQFSLGYGNRGLYHYPLSNGKWLLTTLTGAPEHVTGLCELAESRLSEGAPCPIFYHIEE
jgi:hypothetical protein